LFSQCKNDQCGSKNTHVAVPEKLTINLFWPYAGFTVTHSSLIDWYFCIVMEIIKKKDIISVIAIIILYFNISVSILDVLLQYTPKHDHKLREFFTLPSVKLLLDWFRLNPVHLSNPVVKTSGYVYIILIFYISKHW
jgi:hypothetical protein